MNKVLVGTILLIGLPIAFLKFRQFGFAALLFLLGVVVLSDSLWNWRYESALRSGGQEAVVTPVGTTYTRIKKRGGEKIRAHVSFRTADGQDIAQETELPPGVLEMFERRERVTVTYLPGKPGYYRFNPWRPAAGDDVLFGAVIMGIAAAWMIFRRRPSKEAAAA
jgi:hypothetical protein